MTLSDLTASYPAIGGWVAVAIYVVTIASCWLTTRESRNDPREHRVWWTITFLVAILAINRRFDLQTMATDFSRIFAQSEGWYGERRPIQAEFIIGLALLSAATASMLLNWARRASRPAQIAVVAVTLATGYVLIRTVSLHQVDRLIGIRMLGVRLDWILEMSAAGVVLLASHWRYRHHSDDNPRDDRGGTA